jgi:hypothetical protein
MSNSNDLFPDLRDSFVSAIARNPLTMASLYKIHTSSNPSEKGKIVKADRNTLHRIVTAFKDSFVKLNIPKFVRTLKSESSDFESSFCLLFVASL